MNEVYQEFLDQGIELHKQGKLDEAEVIYNRLLNRKNFEESILFLLADLYLRKEYNGLAINLLSNLLQNNPNNPKAWCNLGVGFRKENFYEFAKAAWFRAIDKGGETVEVCSNLAGLYADRAEPIKAIEWCDKALKLDPVNVEANWQKSLALLTLKNWEEGWKLYEWRQKLANWDSRSSIECPIWDFTSVDHLYIHGEQGIGDEVMFLSCLQDALPLAKRITAELNEKLEGIVHQTWPSINFVSSETPDDYDAKIPIGSLAAHFRKSKFPGKPYLKPDPKRVQFYREELSKLGKGPYVALTWFGGAKQTRTEERSMDLGELKPIFERYTCVSAQYLHTNPMLDLQRESFGLPKINNESSGADIAEQAALFKAVDAVVTVQQTAVHVAGAVGAKTFAMISQLPHWRYGIDGPDLPWYKSVSLFRRENEDWGSVVNRILEGLNAYFGTVQAA